MALWPMLLQTVFPARCAGCGTAALALCPACLAGVRPAPAARPPPGIDWWASPFAYEGALRELIARAKYRNARAGLPWLAAAVAGSVRAAGRERVSRVDAVTWPPTTGARRRQRGFDQAERLARAVARELGLPARPLLARLPGPPQTGRSRLDRARGPVFAARATVAGARLLVVDDVATTGATLAAAARSLRAAGATLVAAATAGRTPHRRGGRGASGTRSASLLKPQAWHADTRMEPMFRPEEPAMVRMGHSDPAAPVVARSSGASGPGGPVNAAPEGVTAARVRQEAVRRLRQQVAAGAYDPPVEELVDRLVSLLLYRQAVRRAGLGE